MSKKEFIDKYLGKAISKKLVAFIIATVALFTGNVTGTEWIVISTAYIAITGYTDTVLRLKDKM
jgi:hypothetical protein